MNRLSSTLFRYGRNSSLIAPTTQLSSRCPLLWTQPNRFLSALPTAAYDQTIKNNFPSLIIGANRQLTPVGSFAQAQAMYLDPDTESVQQLATALQQAKCGVVAHYYMDVELQGVLQAVKKLLPGRIGIADSLRMGDMAVEMASDEKVTSVACLGVDFMSESVQAILSKNGFQHIPVYRAQQRAIGCSLAESAERESYRAWLQTENTGNCLHVIYINTSLETKAVSSSLVPTITCTSSNVLKTLLQASAQVPDLKILYGPDTYMGYNLESLLDCLTATGSGWDDATVAKQLHPQHTLDSLKRLRDNITVYPSGNCVVHHMFGASVVQTVREKYSDCFVTAHLEVPGEMFQIALEKSLQDEGVVGSTSDILNFITRKVDAAATAALASGTKQQQRLRFILGTEAGMVTSIVQNVQTILQKTGNQHLEAEIIFPVASDAVMGTDDPEMSLVPGVAGGEGCSTAGGCATCPFMKMNDLNALMDVLEMIQTADPRLQRHLPPDRLGGRFIAGRSAADLGSEAILYMRALMKDQRLPEELVQKILRTK